jgi:E3 SUMO-protein ligase PIAS1
MVFCAGEGHGRQDIAFPHQSEIKVNGGEIKANLRGLKNKPGSTRPVDITKELRLNIVAYNNNVEMTYALTSKVGGSSQVSCLNPKCSSPLFPIASPLCAAVAN